VRSYKNKGKQMVREGEQKRARENAPDSAELGSTEVCSGGYVPILCWSVGKSKAARRDFKSKPKRNAIYSANDYFLITKIIGIIKP